MMRRIVPRIAIPALAAVSLAVLAAPSRLSGQEAAAGDYETPPTFKASEILDPEVLRGEGYEVIEEVTNDGIMNTIRISSDFGRFESYGQASLAKLIQEIGALVQLEELSKTRVFADAVKRSATSQVEAVKAFADKPVETVKGVPGGLKRTFKRYKRSAKVGYEVAKDVVVDDDEGGDGQGEESSNEEQLDKAEDTASAYAKKYFGISGAELRWAAQLGVDPYSSNEVLRKKIKEVAKVDATASFGMKFVPIPSIPGADVVVKVNQIVWTADPGELREHNKKRLEAMGAGEDLIGSFLDNPHISPSYQTFLASGLESLEGVEDRLLALQLFSEAESETEALFYIGSLRLLLGFHRGESPIVRFLLSHPVLSAVSEDNRVMAFAAVDYLCWTDTASATAGRLFGGLGDRKAASHELLLTGGLSERFHREMKQMGWTVRDRVKPPPPKEKQQGEGQKG